MTVMLRKRACTEAEISEIADKWTEARPIILPGRAALPLIGEVLAGRKTLTQYEAESPRFVGPVWDDSPFYFAIERPWRMPGAIAERMMKWLLGPSVGMLALFAVFGKPRRKIEADAYAYPAGQRPAYPGADGTSEHA